MIDEERRHAALDLAIKLFPALNPDGLLAKDVFNLAEAFDDYIRTGEVPE